MKQIVPPEQLEGELLHIKGQKEGIYRLQDDSGKFVSQVDFIDHTALFDGQDIYLKEDIMKKLVKKTPFDVKTQLGAEETILTPINGTKF